MGYAFFQDGVMVSWSRFDQPTGEGATVETEEPPAEGSRLVDGVIVEPTSEETAARLAERKKAEVIATVKTDSPFKKGVEITATAIVKAFNLRFEALGQPPVTREEIDRLMLTLLVGNDDIG